MLYGGAKCSEQSLLLRDMKGEDKDGSLSIFEAAQRSITQAYWTDICTSSGLILSLFNVR